MLGSRLHRLSLGTLAFVLSTGFVQIHDEVIVKASGGAIVRRRVVSPAVEELDKLLDLHVESKEREQQRSESRTLREKLCDAVTGSAKLWDSCRWEGTTLFVEKRYSSKESSFSSAEDDRATFALHHFLSNGLTRPPFPLINIGPVMQSDEKNREFIRDLREKGFQLDLTVRMPGRITYYWGAAMRDGPREVQVNLLEEWPEERVETFLMSDRGLLYHPLFQWIATGAIVLALVMWTRYHRASF